MRLSFCRWQSYEWPCVHPPSDWKASSHEANVAFAGTFVLLFIILCVRNYVSEERDDPGIHAEVCWFIDVIVILFNEYHHIKYDPE